MSTVFTEIQSLSPSALIELFVMDLTLQGGPVLYFHAGTNGLNASIVWNGQTYTPFPVQTSGFKQSGIGALPRPKISSSNVQGAMSALARQYGDFVGCKLTRIRTFARFLDAVNFPGGINAGADPTQALPNEIWFFDRKSNESASTIEFELAAAMDVGTVTLPRRQFIQNNCPWVYRDANCGYTGGPVATADDVATSVAAQDVCGKRLTSCKLRFGDQAALPFGGFPGCGIGTS